MNKSNSIALIILGIVLVCICCIALLMAVGLANYLLIGPQFSLDGLSPSISTATNTPVVIRPTLPPTLAPGTTPESQPSSGLRPDETLRTLSQELVPINDLPDLVGRLEGLENVPVTVEPASGTRQVGDRDQFWVSNVDTSEHFQVPATLRYVTDHAYFWIQDDLSYRQADLQNLAETFENNIYPTDREFFGSEWSPGVDGDPHLYILYAEGLGQTVAAYFSSTDEYSPVVNQYSNAHEMFIMNADSITLWEDFTYGVLAHEFQHMIHWYRDRNESSWMNEGFSDLAMFLNGYDIGGHDLLYVENPDIQLNDWPNDQTKTAPHYGASFLFTTYFLDRFGEDATKALVSDPENGMDSIDNVMQQLGEVDPLNGEQVTADSIFSDWTLATYLKDGSVGDGRYTYHNYSSAPQTDDTEKITSCRSDTYTRDVHQYGVDYIAIQCPGNTTLRFEGSTLVGVLDTSPHSGAYAFWSNKGDESDMTLTRSFDFSDYSGPLNLTYWTWYDIEEDYDYLYLETSVDGENWTILHTPSGTGDNPTGANYGWAYNGVSGGGESPQWIQESVDISRYAGQEVQLRFEYVTDAAVNGEGFMLDDVSIPETGYSTDFEEDEGGWDSAGFVRIQNALPQSFRLALIRRGQGTTIEYLDLSPDNVMEVPLDFDGDLNEAVLVVSGTTRFTRQLATYRFNFLP
jgi:immune inhibitor A